MSTVVDVYLRMTDPDGNPVDHEVSGPGGRIRVAVGRAGRRASVWRVWANERKPDVFIAARTVGGVQK
jgi:hypothetical protein